MSILALAGFVASGFPLVTVVMTVVDRVMGR